MTILLQGQVFIAKAFAGTTELSSRPKRTRISCYAASPAPTRAAFRKENRTKLANATKFYRKSGEA
jgi:hypothetical protein